MNSGIAFLKAHTHAAGRENGRENREGIGGKGNWGGFDRNVLLHACMMFSNNKKMGRAQMT